MLFRQYSSLRADRMRIFDRMIFWRTPELPNMRRGPHPMWTPGSSLNQVLTSLPGLIEQAGASVTARVDRVLLIP